MTTESYHRCSHCGAEYVYQGSGPGCNRPTNDQYLCPSCKTVTNAALKAVPRRYQERWLDVTKLAEAGSKDLRVVRAADVTIDMVLAWERIGEAETIARGDLRVRQIWPALCRIETGEWQSIRSVRGRDAHLGMLFRVSTWPSSPADAVVEISMEYDSIDKRFTGNLWR
jgi:hypothetical protein